MSDAAPPVSPYPTGQYLSQPWPTQAPGPVARAVEEFRSAHDEAIPGRLLVSAVGVGIASVVLVVGHLPGIGVALAALAVWLPALPALVRRRAWSVLLTVALALALASVAAVRTSPWVVGLCLLGFVAVSAVAAMAARSPLGIGLAVPALPFAAVRAIGWAWSGLTVGVQGRRAEVLRWVRTAVLTLVLLVVFGILLSSADAVFAGLLPRWNLSALPAQFVAGVFATVAALLILSLTQRRPGWAALALPRPRSARRAEWYVPVLALDALILAFLAIQVVAALGGDAYVQSTAGLTYAAYARQGFGQLVAVTVLTVAVVAWFAHRAPRASVDVAPGGESTSGEDGAPGEDGARVGERAAVAEGAYERLNAGGARVGVAPRLALGVLCLAALGVVVTALRRMALYVDAYGLTELRILATAGEVVLGVTLLLVLAGGVRWSADWLPLAVVRLTAVVALGLALLNPDGLIVRYNTEAQDTPLDLVHLRSLSDDAVPEIAGLGEPLRSCLLSWYYPVTDPSPWGWNLARAEAVAVDDVTVQTGCSRSSTG